jgi:hypothetical protein
MQLSKILKKKLNNPDYALADSTEIESVKQLGLFDFFKLFFSFDSNAWSEVSSEQKMKHSYMLLEYLSINEPEIATLSQNMLSPAIIDALHLMFSKNYNGRVPGWMYSKVSRQKKLDLAKFDKSIVRDFKNRYTLDFKDIQFLLIHQKSELEEFLTDEQQAREFKKIK